MSAGMVPGRVGILSLGLIGGSFAKAFAAGGREVFAYDISDDVMAVASIETIQGTLDDQTIPTCELIILAGYPEICVAWLRDNAALVNKDAIVMDIAGVKGAVCGECFELAAAHGFSFVGTHPMAGTQFSGFAHARANLFHNAPMVLVPPEGGDMTRLQTLDRLESLLEPCGFGFFSVTTPERHDRLIAYTSQLAHVVSNAYVKSPTAREHRGFSAGSYKDLTRVARLNAPMWRELFLDNADCLSYELGLIIESLQQYKDAIDESDGERLEALLAEGDRLKREAEAR